MPHNTQCSRKHTHTRTQVHAHKHTRTNARARTHISKHTHAQSHIYICIYNHSVTELVLYLCLFVYIYNRRQSWESGVATPRFRDRESWGVVVSPLNIIISHNVQKYDMKTLSKLVTFQNRMIFVY